MSEKEPQPAISNENQSAESTQEDDFPIVQSEVSQYTKEIKFPTRLYINNVSYKTTEEDLWELFKDYEV